MLCFLMSPDLACFHLTDVFQSTSMMVNDTFSIPSEKWNFFGGGCVMVWGETSLTARSELVLDKENLTAARWYLHS